MTSPGQEQKGAAQPAYELRLVRDRHDGEPTQLAEA
jgi:hypothetical protein